MTTSGDSQASGAAPLDVHSTRASIARVYDAALGGVDNFEIDRQVVYVDNDAAVIAHSEVLLAGDELSRIVSADIFQPSQVLGHNTVRTHLDFSRPMALLQVGTLHHYTGDDGADLMRRYVKALPSGSFVVVRALLRPRDR